MEGVVGRTRLLAPRERVKQPSYSFSHGAAAAAAAADPFNTHAAAAAESPRGDSRRAFLNRPPAPHGNILLSVTRSDLRFDCSFLSLALSSFIIIRTGIKTFALFFNFLMGSRSYVFGLILTDTQSVSFNTSFLPDLVNFYHAYTLFTLKSA